MTDAAFRRALQATARIAGLATLVACGPVAGAPIEEDPADPYTEDVPSDEPEVTCAEELPVVVADYLDNYEVDAFTDAQGTCCQAFVDDVNDTEVWPTDEAGANTLAACCTALGWPEGLACTPWGPPAPPAMRAVA